MRSTLEAFLKPLISPSGRFLSKSFVFALAFSVHTAAGAAQSQKSATRHLVIVMEGQNIRVQPQVNGLRNGLEELKYIEGENFTWTQIEGGGSDQLRLKLRSLMERQRIDVLVTLGTIETTVAKEIATKTPIVFLPVPDPVESGFVQSLASPRTNLTGLAFFTGNESMSKQLEVFKQAIPSMRKVWAISDDRLRTTAGESWTRLKDVAAWLRLELAEQAVTSTDDAARKIDQLYKPGANDGVFVICSGLFKDVERLAAVAAKRKLPLFGCNTFQVAEQNAVLSYAPDLYSLGYRGAWFVDRLFRGAKPQELPVEMPRKFELVINIRAAGEVGLKIPPEILMLSDRVFR